MKKTPSVFRRDYDGNRQVFDDVVPGSEWVLAGEGTPTVKWDGTSCMVRDGRLFKRFDRKHGKTAPADWEAAEEAPDANTGHWPGWVPVGDGPEDRWHREAWDAATGKTFRFDGRTYTPNSPALVAVPEGTYELCGPKVQGNPHRFETHILIRHGSATTIANPRTFEEIREYLRGAGIEGIVWHHPDGRMAKVKATDFGFRWPVESP